MQQAARSTAAAAVRKLSAARLFALAGVVAATVAGVFFLPLVVPIAAQTVSLSYPVMFNNRVAWISFAVGALLVGIVLRGSLGDTDSTEERLPLRLLWISMVVGLFLPLCIRYAFGVHYAFEAELFLDRMRQVTLHRVAFREFEFAYGPLLLYPPVVLSTVFNVSSVVAYFACMCAYTSAGAAMLYYIVQQIDLQDAPRRAVYALACINFPFILLNEGLNYQPLRPLTTPFVALCVFWTWKYQKNPYVTAVAGALAVAVGFEVSAEQGMGLLLGLPAWILLLTFRSRVFPFRAALLHVALVAGIYFAVLRDKWLLAMQGFSVGGNNFPLLVSPFNLAVLALYTCGFVLLWRAIATKDLSHNYVLLILCGIGVLPSAMGRCDSTHLIASSSLFIVSMMAAQSRPLLRRYIIYPLWILLPLAFIVPQSETLAARFRTVGWHPASHELTAAQQVIPRDRVFYSPFSTAVSQIHYGYVGFPIDQGFFAGFENVMTAAQLDQVLAEFQTRKGMPIVLPTWWDSDPRVRIWDTHPRILRKLELSFYYPRLRRPVISTAALDDYIVRHYRPTSLVEDGRRVWEYVP